MLKYKINIISFISLVVYITSNSLIRDTSLNSYLAFHIEYGIKNAVCGHIFCLKRCRVQNTKSLSKWWWLAPYSWWLFAWLEMILHMSRLLIIIVGARSGGWFGTNEGLKGQFLNKIIGLHADQLLQFWWPTIKVDLYNYLMLLLQKKISPFTWRDCSDIYKDTFEETFLSREDRNLCGDTLFILCIWFNKKVMLI